MWAVKIHMNCCKILSRPSQLFLERLISLVSGKCWSGQIVPGNFRTLPKLKLESISIKLNYSELEEKEDLQINLLALAKLKSLINSLIYLYLCFIFLCVYIINIIKECKVNILRDNPAEVHFKQIRNKWQHDMADSSLYQWTYLMLIRLQMFKCILLS